jgi:hypothetical protein
MNFLLREPDAGNLHVRFDERDVETERLAPPRHVSTLPRIIHRWYARQLGSVWQAFRRKTARKVKIDTNL